jgi:hypothetical protein
VLNKGKRWIKGLFHLLRSRLSDVPAALTSPKIGRDGPRQWPPGAKPRRIDGVRIVAPALPDGMYTYARRENRRTVEDLSADARVEVIEVKRTLPRLS